jgi:hypothetical protein
MRAGLVTTQREIKAGGQTIGRVRITEAGRTGARRLNPHFWECAQLEQRR